MRHCPVLTAAVMLVSCTVAAVAAPPPGARSGSVAGIEWKLPAGWSEGAGSAMRVATYSVPAAKGSEPGECAVFFFGSGQGGSTEANVERWSKQFEGSPKPARTETKVAGMRVVRAQLDGSYLAPGGPMMQSTGRRAGYRLLGAIVEAPEGNVFFKLTGPAATVGAATAAFDALVASIRRR